MNGRRLDNLIKLRNHLLKSFEVFEPQPTVEGTLDWMRVENSSAMEWPFFPQLPQLSPKQFFFPERETLFRFNGKDFTETLPAVQPRALLGVRACDLVAIAYQDQFFKDDPYYQIRRKKTLLVGMDCHEPCQGGFCPSVDAGPAVRPGTADLVLDSIEEGWWLVISMTNLGEKALGGLSLEPALDGWQGARLQREQKIVGKFPDVSYIHEGIRKINAHEVAPKTWEALGIQCFQCSGCTNLCRLNGRGRMPLNVHGVGILVSMRPFSERLVARIPRIRQGRGFSAIGTISSPMTLYPNSDVMAVLVVVGVRKPVSV